MKERNAGLTQEYDKLLKEYAKSQVGGEGWEMGVDLAWEQALVTCAAGHAFLRPQEGLGGVGERFTWGLALKMRAWKDAIVFSSSAFAHECSILIGEKMTGPVILKQTITLYRCQTQTWASLWLVQGFTYPADEETLVPKRW